MLLNIIETIEAGTLTMNKALERSQILINSRVLQLQFFSWLGHIVHRGSSPYNNWSFDLYSGQHSFGLQTEDSIFSQPFCTEQSANGNSSRASPELAKALVWARWILIYKLCQISLTAALEQIFNCQLWRVDDQRNNVLEILWIRRTSAVGNMPYASRTAGVVGLITLQRSRS